MDSGDDVATEDESVSKQNEEVFSAEEPQDSEHTGKDNDDDDHLAEGEWKVEKIVDHRQRKRAGKIISEYKIRWEGFEEQDDTWEAEEFLNCRELLKEFHTQSQNPTEHHDALDSDVEVTTEHSKSMPDGLYVVEKILDIRSKRGRGPSKKEYLVQWKDYPGEDSWEEHIDAPELLKQFLAKQCTLKTVASSSRKKTAPSSAVALRTSKRRASAVSVDEPVFQRPSRVVVEKEKSSDLESRSDEEYEVAAVIGRRDRGVGKNRFVEYQIRWKGNYTPSWEPEEKLQCPDLIKEYENGLVQSTFLRSGNDLNLRKSKIGKKKSPEKLYLLTNEPAMDSVATSRGSRSRRTRNGEAVSDKLPNSSRNVLLKESEVLKKNLARKISPNFAARYPRRGQQTSAVGSESQGGAGETSRSKRVTARMTANGAHRLHPRKKAPIPKTSKINVPGKRKNGAKDYSKDLEVHLMRDSEILAVKSFKYNPKDMVEWKNFQFDSAEIFHENEPVKVFGRAIFTDFPDQVFFLVIQAAAPHLYLGITEEFMMERYPKTYENLDPKSLLQVGTELNSATDGQEEEMVG